MQRTFHCLSDVAQTSGNVGDDAIFDLEAELGGQHHLSSPVFERPPEQSFFFIEDIPLCGVEKINAEP